MVKMISLTRHDFDGKTFETGDKFETEEKYSAVLILLGKAAIDTDTAFPADDAKYETRQMTASTGKRGNRGR